MMSYPIMLILKGQQTLVIGCGQVAMRKAQSLAEAGALVTIVSKDLPDAPSMDNIKIIHASYDRLYFEKYLEGAKLVYACTDDPKLNAQIAADARDVGALVNCVDQPEDCDFFVPAIVSTGSVTVAIGTGGAAPALAGRLKKCISDALPERVGDFATALATMRNTVKARIDDINRRGEILKKLAGDAGYQAYLSGGEDALQNILNEYLQ